MAAIRSQQYQVWLEFPAQHFKIRSQSVSREMVPLVTNRRCLVWLRICSPVELTTQRQNAVRTTFAMIVLALLVCVVAACLTFCLKFISIDVGRSVFAILSAIIGISAICMAAVGIISLRRKIDGIFDNLSTIYKKRNFSLFVSCKMILYTYFNPSDNRFFRAIPFK